MSSVPEWLATLDTYDFEDVSTDDKVDVLQSVLWDIESREPWYFLEGKTNLTFDGTSAVPSNLPTDLRAVRRITDTATGRRVRFARIEELEDTDPLGLDTVGTPVWFYFEGGQLHIYRVPSATSSLRLRYFKISNPITATTTESEILLPRRHHAAVLYGALAILYAQDDDFDYASYWDGKMEQRIQNMHSDLWQRQFDAADYILVTNTDDLDFD